MSICNDNNEFNANILENEYLFKYVTEEMQTKWRCRKLLENVGGYNILMEYDKTRNAFIYYCDNTTNVPYPLLNAIAMKFVITFRCIDYFIDNSIDGYDNKSLFLDQLIKSSNDVVMCKQNSENTLFNLDDSPFARLKQHYSRMEIIKHDKLVDKVDEKIFNKFIYLGKFYNTSFLIPVKIKQQINKEFKYGKNWKDCFM